MRILFFVLAFFIFNAASAQIVNVESARMQSDTVGWKGTAAVGMTAAKNVDRIFILNTDAHLQYKSKKDLWLILARSNFLKAGDEKFINNGFVHIRHNHKVNEWLRWEAFFQAQSDQVTQIENRFLLGTGPRFKIFTSPKIRMYAATLVMMEWEKERVQPPVRHRDLRSSSYLTFTIIPAANLELISTTFYQPLFSQLNDYRFLNQSVLKVKATKRFSISLVGNYLFDSDPAGTAPGTTYSFNMGVGYEF